MEINCKSRFLLNAIHGHFEVTLWYYPYASKKKIQDELRRQCCLYPSILKYKLLIATPSKSPDNPSRLGSDNRHMYLYTHNGRLYLDTRYQILTLIVWSRGRKDTFQAFCSIGRLKKLIHKGFYPQSKMPCLITKFLSSLYDYFSASIRMNVRILVPFVYESKLLSSARNKHIWNHFKGTTPESTQSIGASTRWPPTTNLALCRLSCSTS